VDTDDWLGPPLPQRYGLWPGGLHCAITVYPDGYLRSEMLPLVVWTREGEPVVFHEYRVGRLAGRADRTQ